MTGSASLGGECGCGLRGERGFGLSETVDVVLGSRGMLTPVDAIAVVLLSYIPSFCTPLSG